MRRRNAGPSNRAVRVSEQLHHELAELIRSDVKDPRVGMVTLTGLDITPDYAHATVWFSVLPDDPDSLKQTLEGLRAASGFLRTQIGRRVRIHTTPELKFVHDPSTNRGIAMGQLIDQAVAVTAEDDDADGEAHADADADAGASGARAADAGASERHDDGTVDEVRGDAIAPIARPVA